MVEKRFSCMSRFLPDSELLRKNMVDGQIRPHCVLNSAIIEAFLAIPKEHFVPKSAWHSCYADKEIQITPGRVVLPSIVLAYILQNVHKGAQEIAVLGCGYGYLPALLSYYLRSAKITAYESVVSCYKSAQEQLAKYPYVGLKYHSLDQPFDINQQFDCIIYDGGSVLMPLQDHLSYLKPEGKIIFIGGKHYPAVCNLKVVNKNEQFIKLFSLDFSVPPLKELARQGCFIF